MNAYKNFLIPMKVFNEVKIPPRVGWDGVVSQILDSATDGKFAILSAVYC